MQGLTIHLAITTQQHYHWHTRLYADEQGEAGHAPTVIYMFRHDWHPSTDGIPQLLEDSDTFELLWQRTSQVSTELVSVLIKMVCYHFKDRYRQQQKYCKR